MLSFLFDLLYVLPAVLYAPVFFLKSRRAGENPRTLFAERLARYTPKKLARLAGKRVLWIHAVSVGEIMVARRWIESMREIRAPFHFVITTVTPTGQKLARQAEAEDVTAFYVPFDFSFCVRSFLNQIRPTALALVETEIWPNLILLADEKKLPIFLINARLSEKSLKGYRRLACVMQPVFSKITRVFAQDNADAERFRALGIAAERIQVCGNIKFDIQISETVLDAFRRERFGLNPNHRVWVAGSTHPGEEESVLNVFVRLRERHPDLRLIIAPRHAERAESLLAKITSRGLSTQLWGRFQTAVEWQVLLIDQIGILKLIYALANFVFMGGSWAPRGGQNPIEPALFQLPILHGEHVFNFKRIYEIFDSAGGSFCVADTEACFQKMELFLNQPVVASEAGRQAGETVKKHRGTSIEQAKCVLDFMGASERIS